MRFYRYIEVVDERLTGEVLLDEALKMMKVSERMSVGTWIDLMSGQSLLFFCCIKQLMRGAIDRRNMERDEDWLPTQTSPRTLS